MDLQEDLTNLQNWSDKWLLQFNAEKCKVMHVGHNYRHQYTITQDNQTYNLHETVEEKDLLQSYRFVEYFYAVCRSSKESNENSRDGTSTV